MATKLGWFGVRDRDADSTETALRAIAAKQRKLALPEDGFRLLTSDGHTAAVLVGWEFAAVHAWAAAASEALDTVAVGFFLLEGCWDYGVYQGGARLSAMTWYPAELPAMVGETKRAAAALGVPVRMLLRYFDAILDGIEAEGGEVRAFPDDQRTIDNEWVHLDRARRLGFAYPDPDEGRVVAIKRAG